MRKVIPINFVPAESQLTFVKQTVVGWRKRSTKEKVLSMAIYRCSCGNEVEKCVGEAKRGEVKSCGMCDWRINQIKKSNTKHGIWNSPLYNVWVDIKNRCYKKRHQAYDSYGGRGVRMCDEWINDPKAFYNWCIDNGWQQGLQVDKDIKGDGLLYSPSTCSIVTNKVNQNNRRSNRYVTINGKKQSVTMWCDEFKINKSRLYDKVKQGYNIENLLKEKIESK